MRLLSSLTCGWMLYPALAALAGCSAQKRTYPARTREISFACASRRFSAWEASLSASAACPQQSSRLSHICLRRHLKQRKSVPSAFFRLATHALQHAFQTPIFRVSGRTPVA